VREFVSLARERGLAPSVLCDELEAVTHAGPTRQEAILDSVLRTLPPVPRAAATALALCEVPLQPDEIRTLLEKVLALTAMDAAQTTRSLASRGLLGEHPRGELALLDAFRLALLASNNDSTLVANSRKAISELLVTSVGAGLHPERLLALLKILPMQGEMKVFIDILSAHSEQIAELGLMGSLERRVRAAATDTGLTAEDRFWALDVIAYLTRGQAQREAIVTMRELVQSGAVLGREERLELANKLIAACRGEAEIGDARDAFARGYAIAASEEERLLLRYALASTCFSAGRYREAERTGVDIVHGYYALLGLEEDDVRMKNLDAVFSAVRADADILQLKRIADAHDLVAMARDALHEHPRLARLDAMKFFEIAQAPVSAVRVGLDAISDFLRYGNDLVGATMVLENHVEPAVTHFRLSDWIVPVTSMRAVLLAYAGRIEDARALVDRAAPLAQGLVQAERDNFERQRSLVEELAADPRRWLVS
jgi:hypothetical protein